MRDVGGISECAKRFDELQCIYLSLSVEGEKTDSDTMDGILIKRYTWPRITWEDPTWISDKQRVWEKAAATSRLAKLTSQPDH